MALAASRSDTGITRLRIVGPIFVSSWQGGHIADRCFVDGDTLFADH